MEELRSYRDGRALATIATGGLRAWSGDTTSWRIDAEAGPTAERVECVSIRPMAGNTTAGGDSRESPPAHVHLASKAERVVTALAEHGTRRVVCDDQRRLDEVGEEEQLTDVAQ